MSWNARRRCQLSRWPTQPLNRSDRCHLDFTCAGTAAFFRHNLSSVGFFPVLLEGFLSLERSLQQATVTTDPMWWEHEIFYMKEARYIILCVYVRAEASGTKVGV